MLFQQYRLFFRYHSGARVIVYAWVKDEDSRRAYERSDDAYRVFRRMLAGSHLPDDWDQLLYEALQEGLRLQQWARGWE
jgi:toxin YhaV